MAEWSLWHLYFTNCIIPFLSLLWTCSQVFIKCYNLVSDWHLILSWGNLGSEYFRVRRELNGVLDRLHYSIYTDCPIWLHLLYKSILSLVQLQLMLLFWVMVKVTHNKPELLLKVVTLFSPSFFINYIWNNHFHKCVEIDDFHNIPSSQLYFIKVPDIRLLILW